MQRILEVLSGIPNRCYDLDANSLLIQGLFRLFWPWLLQTGYQWPGLCEPRP